MLNILQTIEFYIIQGSDLENKVYAASTQKALVTLLQSHDLSILKTFGNETRNTDGSEFFITIFLKFNNSKFSFIKYLNNVHHNNKLLDLFCLIMDLFIEFLFLFRAASSYSVSFHKFDTLLNFGYICVIFKDFI